MNLAEALKIAHESKVSIDLAAAHESAQMAVGAAQKAHANIRSRDTNAALSRAAETMTEAWCALRMHDRLRFAA